MHVGAQLACGGATGAGSLQSMAACDGPMAVVAHAEMNVELSEDDATWNLRLILPRDVGFVQTAAATVWALIREWRVVLLIDPRRPFAMGMSAMAFAFLPPRLLGLFCRLLVLTKRCRLTFPLFAQGLDLMLQLGDSALECRDAPAIRSEPGEEASSAAAERGASNMAASHSAAK